MLNVVTTSLSQYRELVAFSTAVIVLLVELAKITNNPSFGRKRPTRYSVVSSELLKLQQDEPRDRTLQVLEAVELTLSAILFFAGCIFVYIWKTKMPQVRPNSQSVFMLVLLFGPLSYSIWEKVVFRSHVKRRRKTSVFASAVIEISGDFLTLFRRCLEVLFEMQARLIFVDSGHRLIRAHLGNNKITIIIESISLLHQQIFVMSDSKWYTVRYDSGSNRRNIDTISRGLLTS